MLYNLMKKRYHLDELVDEAIHNLMRRDTRKHFEVLNGDSIIGPCQGQSSVIPDTRCLVTHFLFAFCSCLLPFRMRSNLFQWGSGKGSLRGFKDGGGWSDRSPFLNDSHYFLPLAQKRLVLLGLRPGIQFLIEFSRHLYMTERGKS